ncbi:MAG: hypothetical protein EHM19_02745, partial [Candidatus Latescibacterota bacterium]
ANLSVLPPYNTLVAQVIRRGDAESLPEIVTQGFTLEYSVPGNTYSAGKTDFWDYDFDLFGVDLPIDVGLTGKGLTGEFDVAGNLFKAEGIPITPFTDAAPTVEDPYQQALVILRDSQGAEVTRAVPVIPVSTEMNCVGSGCHASETAILNQHPGPGEGGFDPNDTPILCADCHGSPPLTGPDPGLHGYFSKRMHEKHAFVDEQIPGIAGCYKCHPGPITQCLRDVMATDHDMVCQDCHGDLEEVAGSIDGGRTPWLEEPACRTCHTATFGEPVGTLYRNATGHGGVLCSGCHNSPHAIFPTREPRDNQVMVDLQGHAGTLEACQVCHGIVPAGPGPHGIFSTAVETAGDVEQEVLGAAARLVAYPSALRPGIACTIETPATNASRARILVFDASGRTVRLIPVATRGGPAAATWDGRDSRGVEVASGAYFLRWDDGARRAATKVVVVR